METKDLYSFGPFQIDASRRLLRNDREVIPLPSKAFDTLLFLVRNHDRLVKKDELMAALWPDAEVEENNLSQCVSAIRKALGDSPQAQQYIETVPGWGYRFAAPVRLGSGDEVRLVGASLPVGLEPRKDSAFLVAGVFVAVIALGVAFYVGTRIHPRSTKPPNASAMKARTSVAVLGFENLSEEKKDQWLATALGEMLRTELAAGGALRIMSADDVAQLAPDLLTSAKKLESLAAPRLQEVNRKLGSDLLIFGSYVVIPDQARKRIRFDVRSRCSQTGGLRQSFV